MNLDFFFQGGLIFFIVFLLWESRNYPFESGIYPQIVGVITLTLLLYLWGSNLRKKREHKREPREIRLRGDGFLKIWLVTVIATLLGFLGGFLLSVLCYYVGYALLQGQRRSGLRHTLGVGVALTAFFYILFGWFMNVPMFEGWLVHF